MGKTKMAKNIIKDELFNIRGLVNKLPTSDLQGLVRAKAIKIVGNKDMCKISEAEDIILQYTYGNMDINSAKRFLLDIRLR